MIKQKLDTSEKLAFWVLSKLLPKGQFLRHIEEQSHGEHDFDIIDSEGSTLGIVEVTTATHQLSNSTIKSLQKQESFRCNLLQLNWSLLAHNPDLKWLKKRGCDCLKVLEEHGFREFSSDTQYLEVEEVADASKELISKGVDNGGVCGGKGGNIWLMTSYGETNDPFILSRDSVLDELFTALDKPDNLRKLSHQKDNAPVARHFFLRIDRQTVKGPGWSVAELSPPSLPPDLQNRATDVWIATNLEQNIFVWRGGLHGWESWKLDIDSELEWP